MSGFWEEKKGESVRVKPAVTLGLWVRKSATVHVSFERLLIYQSPQVLVYLPTRIPPSHRARSVGVRMKIVEVDI